MLALEYTRRFERDLKRLPTEHDGKLRDLLKALQEFPLRTTWRHHALGGTDPKIHVVDLTSNHAYQLTFYIEADCIRLLRISTHAEIDRSPR